MGALLNRRRYMGGGSSLPYDAEVDFIESSGTQWIGTGIVPNFSTTVEAKAAITKAVDSHVISARTTGNNNGRFFVLSYSNNDQARNVIAGSQSAFSYDYDRHPHTVVFNEQSTHNCYFDGVFQRTLTSGNTVNQQNQLTMFGSSGYTGECSGIGYVKIYYVKIIVDGTLIRDYIPVRIGQVGYMYDKISGQLYGNNGTGEFIIGPDKQKGLPYNSEIEYLQFDGNEYFDTLVTPNETIECEMSIMPLIGGQSSALFGARNKNYQASSYINSLSIWWLNEQISFSDISYASSWTTNVISYDSIYKIQILSRGLYVNDSLVLQSPDTNEFSFDVSYGLLRCNYINMFDTRPGNGGRIYYCKIWKDNVLVRDFITVREGLTGCLYDKVSGTMFYYKGSGTMVLGNDL